MKQSSGQSHASSKPHMTVHNLKIIKNVVYDHQAISGGEKEKTCKHAIASMENAIAGIGLCRKSVIYVTKCKNVSIEVGHVHNWPKALFGHKRTKRYLPNGKRENCDGRSEMHLLTGVFVDARSWSRHKKSQHKVDNRQTDSWPWN